MNSVKEQLRELESKLAGLKAADKDSEVSKRNGIHQLEYEIRLLRALLKKDGYAIVGNEVQELRE